MSTPMSWVAIGLGLFVLWQVIAHWPGGVTERPAVMESSATRLGPVGNAGLTGRSLTSRVRIDGLLWCADCHRAVDRGWEHATNCRLESLPAPHRAGERGDRPDSLRSSALRGLTAPAGATVFDWDADGFGDAA